MSLLAIPEPPVRPLVRQPHGTTRIQRPQRLGDSQSEEWRGGGGSNESGGNEECWEVWLVWRNALGGIVSEQYLGTVCFEKGGGSGGVT